MRVCVARRMTAMVFLVAAFLLFAGSPARAATITFGTTGGGGNAFPFGGYAPGFAGTEYQQVYNAALFGSDPLLITSVEFFGSSGTYDDGTYSFRLSTTSKAVNALDTTTLSNNIGADQMLFATQALSGSIPSVLTVSGGPFYYDPALGNLLLDIQNSSPTVNFSGFYFSMNGNFGTDSSRAHNYGTAFSSFGLVTRFTVEPASAPVPEPATLTMLGVGLVGLGARRWRQRKH